MIVNEYYVLKEQDGYYLQGPYGDRIFLTYEEAQEQQQEWLNGPVGRKYAIIKRSIVEEIQE